MTTRGRTTSVRRAGRTAVGATALVLLAACGGAGSPAANSTAPSATASSASHPTARTSTLPPTTTRPASTSPTVAPTSPTTAPTAGTPIAGEGLTADQASALQADVDAGHQPWRLDQAAVASAFVAGPFGWQNAHVALADPHTAEVTNPSDGRMLTLQLRQPVRQGQGGIWVVDSGVWLQ